MPFIIPTAARYQRPLNQMIDDWQKAPPEGGLQIPLEITWTDYPGATTPAGKAVNINFNSMTTKPMRRIAALVVDNSKCGADVRFIFTDVDNSIVIPAYSPQVIVPVFSNLTNFYVINDNEVISGDVTRFSCHNTVPPPIAIPISELQNVAASAGIEVDGTSNNVIAASTVNGTLDSLQLTFSNTIIGASQYLATFRFRDGANRTLGIAQLSSDSSTDIPENGSLFNMTGMNIRFSGGITMQQALLNGTITAGQSFVSANALYRTP